MSAMNVYVESNFVLEQEAEQEQCESCEELIRLAAAGSIRLVADTAGGAKGIKRVS